MSFFAAVDLNGLLQFIFTLFTFGGFLLYLVKITASNYFLIEESDNDSVPDWSSAASSSTSGFTSNSSATINNRNSVVATGKMGGEGLVVEACVVCGNLTKKQCSGCKMVKYCSPVCQRSHWNSGHKAKCKDLELSGKSLRSVTNISGGSCSSTIRAKKILFPYEEFVEFFNWDKPGFPPCGLINCGNSCFANVVLQCLAYTKPLVAFLLEKGHRRECRRNDWCFLCEFESHVERVNQSSRSFSPINILSRLPNMGGNLGYGKQEDAHEFMRFAIDTMQSACLDKFGGEKVLHPSSQETTLIQHIFGGHLQSKVICEKCKNVSNQFENMMDLTVEIHGDAASLEECLDQFTAKECLDGDNMYKCDGCNDYTMAWKRLTVRCAPNILTIALKRFQRGRFGKLNKRVTFPETLDLSRYMSEGGDDMNIYKLYAVIVHLDMLNASFFGHYICYIKDFRGKWYRIDDCKVIGVDLEDVLSQGAYMLLYSRIRARSSSLYPVEISKKIEQENVTLETEVVLPSSVQPVSQEYTKDSCTIVNSGLLQEISESKDIKVEETTPTSSKSENEDVKMDIQMEDLIDINIHKDTDHTVFIGDDNILTGPCSSSLVEDENVVSTPSSFSFTDSYEVPVAIDNHVVDTEEKLQVSCAPEEVNSSSGGSHRVIASSGGPQRVIAPVVQVSSVSVEVNTASGGPQQVIAPVLVSSVSEEVNSSSGSPQRVIAQVVQVSSVSEEVKRVIAPFAGRSLNGRRSRARSTPFLPPGFLDKRRPPKKSTKQEVEILELGQQQVPSSNSKLTCKINGVIKPVFLGQNDRSVRRPENIENGDCSNHNNDLTL